MQTLTLDGVNYSLSIKERHAPNSGVEPVLCLISYLPNKAAMDIIRIAVESIRKYTTVPYSLWVVDNASPTEHLEWLRKQDDITLVENLTPPKEAGSYANAIGLEICARLVPEETTRFMALHQDILVCKTGWLEYLLSKFSDAVRAVGVREDTSRVQGGILHVLGYIVDFKLFKQLKLNFYPRLPEYDVGDMVIHQLRLAGYKYFATPNTLWQREISLILPEAYASVEFDRSIDDDGDVFFMHLGRGSLKSDATFEQDENKSFKRWKTFAHEELGISLPIEIVPRYEAPKHSLYTFRRWNLDAFLSGTPWYGKILDIGGKKHNRRGSFKVPTKKISSWECINISPEASPDYCASAEALPFSGPRFDMVLLSEVLEHLPNPEKALHEAARVLLPGGHIVIAAPFLFPLHADPDDFQRWLPSKYKKVLKEIGFQDIMVYSMGGFFAVVFDLIYTASNFSMQHPGLTARLFRKILPLLHRLFVKLENKYPKFSSFITTGYCVCAMKPTS